MEQQFLVIQVTEDDEGRYIFTCGPGMSVQEVAFAMAAFAKVLVREGYIKKPNDFVKQIRKFMNDPKYNEIKETDDGTTSAGESEKETEQL